MNDSTKIKKFINIAKGQLDGASKMIDDVMDYYKEHKKITFDTIYEYGTYEVMYVFYSKVYDNDDLVFKYYQFIEANSEAEFNYYMDEMKKLSLYDTGVTAKYGDTLLTLSTCDHSQTDGRFAVVAKRIK